MTYQKNKSKKRTTTKSSVKKHRFSFAWPYIVFLLLCVGVLLSGWTFQTGATDIKVTARIPAPLPTDPAVITSPLEGDRFSEIPITVKGTCPLDSYVNLYTNNYFRGSVVCAADGTFELDIDLFPGANELRARVFNVTDDEGPQSGTLNVFYDVPETPSQSNPSPLNPTTPGITPSPSTSPFLIKTNFKYVGYSVGQSVKWNFAVSGGNSPYAINIDWGDGKNSVISQKEAGEFTVEHIYKEKGKGPNSGYIIKVTGSDSADRKNYLQLFVIVNPSNLGSIVANTIPPKPPISDNWLLLIWPAYIVVILMTLSFYLGEKEEFLILKKRGYLRTRRT